jgi:hypothetical protein
MVFIPSTCSRITSRITSRVSSRIWRGALWRVHHLRADSEVWLSHTSSIWPWSGTPKVRLYDTFLGVLRQQYNHLYERCCYWITLKNCSLHKKDGQSFVLGAVLEWLLYLEECSEGSPSGLISLSVSPSFCPSIWNTKKCRFWTNVLKSGCPRGVFCLSSVPSKYLFLCARRKFGFNKKIGRSLLIVYVYYQPNWCITNLILALQMQSMNGLEEPF